MKIITNAAVYVQKNDIAFLITTNLPIPDSLLAKIHEIRIDDNNKYDFVKFENVNEIDFFSNLDWIIDYASFKNLSEDEIAEKLINAIKEKDKITYQGTSITDIKPEDNLDIVAKCKLLDFKIYSIRDFLFFKQGYLKIELPEEVNYSQRNGIQRLIRKFLAKGNK